MNVKRTIFTLLCGIAASAAPLYAGTRDDGNPGNRVDLKTDLLHDITGTMAFGAEVPLHRFYSLDFLGLWNPWTFSDDVKYKRWEIMAEPRLWFRSAPQRGHFIGLHLFGGEFNYSGVTMPFGLYPSLRDNRYEGWFAGGGVSYGYRWNFTSRIGMEGVVGVGLAHVDYQKYRCGHCGERIGSGKRLYVGPTRLSLNLIVRFGKDASVREKMIDEALASVVSHSHPGRDTCKTDTVYIVVPEQDSISQSSKVEASGVRCAELSLRLNFKINDTSLVEDYAPNEEALATLRDLVHRYAADPSMRIISVVVRGYASVDGPSRRNAELSQGRADAVASMLADSFPSLRAVIDSKGMGEDWESLDFEGKDTFMEISDEDMREAALRAADGGKLFNGLKTSGLPFMRRTECVITYSTLSDVE